MLRRIRWQVLILLVLLFSIMLGIMIGSATANTVPASYASETSEITTIDQLTPPECQGMGLTNLIIVTAPNQKTQGSRNNDLILGTSGPDEIKAKKGADCIIGGGGDDILDGGGGDDYIDGGNGIDSCNTSKGTDIANNCEL